MSELGKRLSLGTIVVAAIVAIFSILDIIIQIPFAGYWGMDICFLISAAILIYLSWETLKEQK